MAPLALIHRTSMLSYRHAFHAGNFADVFKHAVLIALLRAVARKEKPFLYLETHAGAGMYNLLSEASRKTGEYEGGIARLWNRTDLPAEVADYLSLVRRFNPNGQPHRYPGSPAIAREVLRPTDRMVLCELHSNEVPALTELFKGDRRVQIQPQDGYKSLAAYLPPRERRGLVFIDPSYEVKEEYAQVVKAIESAHRRWASGSYAIWYPLLKSRGAEPFGDAFQKSGIRKILRAEITVENESPGMRGTGMILINPPWLIKETLETLLPWLTTALGGTEGDFRVDWLVEE